jgi:Intraflagellar transport protein 43
MACVQVANAPKSLQVQPVQDLDDLESKELRQLKHFLSTKMQGSNGAATAAGDCGALDFGILLEALMMPDHLDTEADEFWDEDGLLTSIGSELHSEAEGRAAMQGAQVGALRS